MARKKKEPRITRTIIFTKAHVLVADATTKSVFDDTYQVSGKYASPELVKEAVSYILPENITCLQVLDFTSETAKYVISESDFIKYGTEIVKDDTYADSTEE